MSFGSAKIAGPPSMSRNRIGRRKSNAQLLRIEQVEHGHVVLAKPQVLEAAAEQFRLDEQVREDDDQRPLADRLGEFVQHVGASCVSPSGFACSSMSKNAGRWAGFRVGGRLRTTPLATHETPTASPCWTAR